MKKMFNYRPLVSICLFIMSGIIFTIGIYSQNIFRLLLSGLMLLALLLTFVFKLFFARQHRLFKLISIFIAFFVGIISSVCVIENHYGLPELSGEFFISARVCDRPYYNKNDDIILTVDSVSATNLETLMCYRLGGKLRFYITADSGETLNYKLGDTINATGKVSKTSLFYNDGTINAYFLTNNIKLSSSIDEADIINLNSSKATIFERFKTKVKASLDKYMSSDYSEVGYAMLFGDRTGIDDGLGEIYTSGGIAHLLAVSGLHVGFLVTLLNLLLTLFKAKGNSRFIIISIVIFLYAMLCGFSTSVTRAMIMTIILLFSRTRKREYDSLSSLALAAILILVFSPLELYMVGFRLSFGAVAGIIILEKPIERFFNRFLHQKLSAAISVSISASLGIAPFMAGVFKNLSIFSVVTNVIVIPIASLAFMLLLPFAFLSVIYSGLAAVGYVFEFLMKIVTGVAQLTGSLSLANVNNWCLNLFGVFIILMVIFASDYIFTKKKTKVISSLSCGLTSVACLAVGFLV